MTPGCARWQTKTRAQVFYYGFDPKADLWADQIEGLGLEGIRFRLHYPRRSAAPARAADRPPFSATVLRAAAVGLVEGLTWQEIIDGLQYGHTQLRLVAVHTENGALLLDDTYNASPESTLAALNLLDEMSGRKVAVLGDMLELGPYEKQGHEMVGDRAAEVCDELVAVGELRQNDCRLRPSWPACPLRLCNGSPTVPEAIEVLEKRTCAKATWF